LADPVEEGLGGFVVRVLRDQFAPEGFGEDGGLQPVEQRAGAGSFRFEAVGAGEGGVYLRRDLLLKGGVN
jgi:hypothetical protein